MLTDLYIKNFAIIDELRVTLGAGLNVLTGETGAGKSIIVDALGASLGQRVGSDVVRTGAEQAVVEAVFDLEQLPGVAGLPVVGGLGALLAENGLEAEEGTLVLSREINRITGRTSARVNRRTVPLSVLQQLGELLVDIHGQSEHLSLLRVREHVDYLDRYGGLAELRAEVSEAVRKLRSVRGEIEQIVRDERESAREIDLLTHQIREIREASLAEDEEERLLGERQRLRNAERLRELSRSVYLLTAGGEEQSGAADLLAQAERLLAELARLDPTMGAESQALETIRYSVEETGERAREYFESLDADPRRLEQLEERAGLIAGLKRKYGRSVGDVMAYCQEAEVRLDRLANRASYLHELRQREAEAVEKVGILASRLSGLREEVSMLLTEEIQQELAGLSMGGTVFRVDLSRAEDPEGVPYNPGGEDGPTLTPTLSQRERESAAKAMVACDLTGVDRVEFLISPNPGEEPRSLARIASGGETARLMLALKTILSKADAIPTLVFDEIDVGVGARSGVRMGERLWSLTRHHQVVCITHMPQIACIADRHLSVAKIVEGGRTRTEVRQLAMEERIQELAAMMAGSAEIASAVASARELLGKAEEHKECALAR